MFAESIAHFYNRAEGRKEVDRNDRTRFKVGDFFCSEYHRLPKGYEIMHPSGKKTAASVSRSATTAKTRKKTS
jgi:hypothetical protein